MSIGEEDSDWALWAVWTIVKWSGIALVFFIAIVVAWLVVLVVLPAHAREGQVAAFARSSLVLDVSKSQSSRRLSRI
jgi:hypothetical protein